MLIFVIFCVFILPIKPNNGVSFHGRKGVEGPKNDLRVQLKKLWAPANLGRGSDYAFGDLRIYFETWAVLVSFYVVVKKSSLTKNFPAYLTYYPVVNNKNESVWVGIPDFASGSLIHWPNRLNRSPFLLSLGYMGPTLDFHAF